MAFGGDAPRPPFLPISHLWLPLISNFAFLAMHRLYVRFRPDRMTICCFFLNEYTFLDLLRRDGLVVNTSDSGSRDRRVVSLIKTYLPPPPPKKKKKVLVIPRKRWLRPSMTEKLFNGALNIKPKKERKFLDLRENK